jgi:hypothetical protein
MSERQHEDHQMEGHHDDAEEPAQPPQRRVRADNEPAVARLDEADLIAWNVRAKELFELVEAGDRLVDRRVDALPCVAS